jgi:hypothetical protein
MAKANHAFHRFNQRKCSRADTSLLNLWYFLIQSSYVLNFEYILTCHQIFDIFIIHSLCKETKKNNSKINTKAYFVGLGLIMLREGRIIEIWSPFSRKHLSERFFSEKNTRNHISLSVSPSVPLHFVPFHFFP